MDCHELSNGYTRFTPDLAMAQSWLRLSEKSGRNIKKHDVLMLYHELVEILLLLNNSRMTQKDAHMLAEKKYNYSQAVISYYKSLGINI